MIGGFAVDYGGIASLAAIPIGVAFIMWLYFRESKLGPSRDAKARNAQLTALFLLVIPFFLPVYFDTISSYRNMYFLGALGIIAAALSKTAFRYASSADKKISACLIGILALLMTFMCGWSFMAMLNILPKKSFLWF
jgi:hypothetical protein